MEFKIFKYSWHFGNHSWTGTEQWKFWVVQGVCSQLRLNRTILCLLVLALIMWTRVILQSSYEKTQMNFSANPIFTAIFSPPYMVFFVFFFFCFFFLVCVCVWSCYLKWPSCIVLKFCLVFLSTRLWYLTEKLCVFDKLNSGLSYNDAGHEFNINEPTIYIK